MTAWSGFPPQSDSSCTLTLLSNRFLPVYLDLNTQARERARLQIHGAVNLQRHVVHNKLWHRAPQGQYDKVCLVRKAAKGAEQFLEKGSFDGRAGACDGSTGRNGYREMRDLQPLDRNCLEG